MDIRNARTPVARLARAILTRALLDAAGQDNQRWGCCDGSRHCQLGPARCALRWLRSESGHAICTIAGLDPRVLTRPNLPGIVRRAARTSR